MAWPNDPARQAGPRGGEQAGCFVTRNRETGKLSQGFFRVKRSNDVLRIPHPGLPLRYEVWERRMMNMT